MTEKELMNFLISEQKEFRGDIKSLIEKISTQISRTDEVVKKIDYIGDMVLKHEKILAVHEVKIPKKIFINYSILIKVVVAVVLGLLGALGIIIIP